VKSIVWSDDAAWMLAVGSELSPARTDKFRLLPFGYDGSFNILAAKFLKAKLLCLE